MNTHTVPEHNVHFGHAQVHLATLRALSLAGLQVPPGKADATEAVPAHEGGWLNQQVVATAAREQRLGQVFRHGWTYGRTRTNGRPGRWHSLPHCSVLCGHMQWPPGMSLLGKTKVKPEVITTGMSAVGKMNVKLNV